MLARVTIFSFLFSLLLEVAWAAPEASSPINQINRQPGEECSLSRWAEDQRTISQRLDSCRPLKRNIFWQEGNGKEVNFADWEPQKKRRLDELFQRLSRGEEDLGIRCPPLPDRMTRWSYLRVYAQAEEAFDVFAAHVAHVLYVEARGLVPWKIHMLPNDEIQQLLSSENYFSVIAAPPPLRPDRLERLTYPEGIAASRDYQQRPQSLTPEAVCDPRVGFRFLQGTSAEHPGQRENLIGATEEETLVNITRFFHNHVGHGRLNDIGGTREEVAEHAYLVDRLRPSRDRVSYLVAPMGCHSAGILFRDLARSVNIPLVQTTMKQEDPTVANPPDSFFGHAHTGLCWRWRQPGARCLPHVDNIYAMDTFFPLSEEGQPILNDEEKFRLYFHTHWVSPVELTNKGMEIVLRSIFNRELPYFRFDEESPYYNLGYYLGHWRLSDRAATRLAEGGSPEPFEHDMFNKYDLYKDFLVNSWHIMNNCVTAMLYQSVPDQYANDYREITLDGAGYPEISNEQILSRITAVAEAYGGCQALQEQRNAWDRMKREINN